VHHVFDTVGVEGFVQSKETADVAYGYDKSNGIITPHW